MEDESTPYLKLFNEGSHNLFLQSNEDGLNDTFSVEPIFAQLSSDWTTEGLPILLSGSLLTEDTDTNDFTNTNVQLVSDEANSPNEGTVTFLSNDMLVRIEDNDSRTETNTFTHVINGNTYSITYEQEQEEEQAQKEPPLEVVQLLNVGGTGTVSKIHKDLVNVVEVHQKPNVENFFTQVQASKCRLCGFLCEKDDDIRMHLLSKHHQIVKQQPRSNSLNVAGTEIKSILNTANNPPKQGEKYIVFFCSECGNAYVNKEDLKRHMVDQHQLICMSDKKTQDKDNIENNSSVKATVSQKIPSRNAASISLLKKQKHSKKIKCSIKGCPFRFAKDEYRKQHEKCHVNNEKRHFQCPECKEKFTVWGICSMHLWKCHKIDLGLLTCPICNNFKANGPIKVVNHMRIHSDEKLFVCSSCGKRFKQMSQLKNHEIIHKPPEEHPDWSAVKQCDACKRCFASSKSLKKHIKFVHDKLKPFICNICGHQTARKEMLQVHYRQHTGDKPYHCSCCEYKSADRNCLRRHLMRHFGVTKYACPYCNYSSIQTNAYKTHMANKHPGKDGAYFCSSCNYATVNSRYFMEHSKTHELEKNSKGKNDLEKISAKGSSLVEDDETQNFLNNEQSEDVVDTGGITIPAGFDLQLTQCSSKS